MNGKPIVFFDYEIPKDYVYYVLKNIDNIIKDPSVKWSSLTSKKEYNGSIHDFIRYMSNMWKSSIFYTKELHIFGTYFVKYLVSNGFRYVETRKGIQPGEFTFFATSMDKWYNIVVCVQTTNYKKPESYAIHEFRDIYHIMPVISGMDEKDFLIYAKSIGLTRKLTIGSYAKYMLKKTVKDFAAMYPELDDKEEKAAIKAYTGAFMFNKNGKYENVQMYDINQLYPYVAKTKPMPYGNGKHIYDAERIEKLVKNGVLGIVKVRLWAQVKRGNFYPSVKIKEPGVGSIDYSKLTGERLWVTTVDIETMLENYDVEKIVYEEGYFYYKNTGLLSSFFDYNFTKRNSAENINEKMVYKIINNSVIGKFGQHSGGVCVHYDMKTKTYCRVEVDCKGGYIPFAAFVNAYARQIIIRAAQKAESELIYSDTDSIYTTKKINFPLSKEMGDWKLKNADILICAGLKKYAYKNKEGWTLKLAGVPKDALHSFKSIKDNDDFVKKFTYGFPLNVITHYICDGVYTESTVTYKIGGIY